MTEALQPAFNPDVIEGTDAPIQLEKVLHACPVKHVTVYHDRAEVNRSILIEKGELEVGACDIVVRDVSVRCDGDSLRVKGQGSFEIFEVGLQVNHATKDQPELKRKEDTLKADLRELEKQQMILTARRSSNLQLNSQVQAYVDNMVSRAKHNGQPGMNVGVDTMDQVMDFYTTQSTALDTQLNQGDTELEALNDKITAIETQLRSLGASNTPTIRRDITISVNVLSAFDELSLELSYVVSGASWEPAYDMRLNHAEQAMSLTYYALVTQNTGEDWNGCHISLSTATPAISGHPPSLPSKVVEIRQTYPAFRKANAKRKKSKKHVGMSVLDLVEDAGMMLPEEEVDESDDDNNSEVPELSAARDFEAGVKNSDATGSSLFEIRREVFIQSDNKSHKVIITTLGFSATLAYYSAPAASPHAYLQAKSRNESDYPLLASNSMNVYVDGSFITKTELKTVHPREVFSAFLGVDPTIKVEYRPAQRKERTTGWVSRSKSTKYEYCTIITNTKPSAALVFVVDSLPKSTLDKIAVEVRVPATESLRTVEAVLGLDESASEQPSFTDAQIIDQLIGKSMTSPFALLNPATNNLIWVNPVAPSQKATLPFSYAISHPTDVSVQLN